MDKIPLRDDSRANPMLRLLRYAHPHRRSMALYLALLLSETGLALLPPYWTKRIIDDALVAMTAATSGPLSVDARAGPLLVYVGALAATLLALHGLRIALGWISSALGAVVTRDLREDLFRKIHRLPMERFDRYGMRDLTVRINQDTASLEGFLTRAVQLSLVNVLYVIGITVVLFAWEWRLAIVALAPVPLIVWLSTRIWAHVRTRFGRVWEMRSRVNVIASESVDAAKVVRLNAMQAREVERYVEASRQHFDAEVDVRRYMAIRFVLVSALTGLVLRHETIYDGMG